MLSPAQRPGPPRRPGGDRHGPAGRDGV